MSVTYYEGEGDVMYAEGADMVFVTNGARQALETRPVRRLQAFNNYQGDFIPWGDDNLHPQRTIELIEENDVLPAVIDFKIRALTSGGLMYGDITIDEQGHEIYRPMRIPEIDDFLEMIEVENYLEEAAGDFYRHANYFPEVILNVGRKVVGLHCNDAAFTRLGMQIKTGRNKGKIDTVFVGANWDYSYSIEDSEPITAVDPYARVVDQILQGRKYKYVIPSRAQSHGRLDYQRGTVDSLIASGWLDLSKSIPKWKNAIMSEQVTIKYQIEVEQGYWKRLYDHKWDKMSAAEKTAAKKKKYDEFINFFRDKKKSGASLFTQYHHSEVNKTEFSDFKITVLKGDKFGEGSYIEDSSQSDAHIIRSQGVDQTLIGYTPGKGFTAGSGSDKRVAFNQYVLLAQPHQRKILRPFDYIAQINDWNKRYGAEGRRLKFWFKNTFIATLDHGKDTKEANSNNNKKT